MPEKTSRRSMLRILGYGVGGATAGLLGTSQYGVWIEPNLLQLKRVQIPLKRLPSSLDGFKIVYLSDFHLYPHTQIEFIQEAVDMANGLKPDLVALGGDFVTARRNLTPGEVPEISELAAVLARLNAKYGVYAVLGNHDHWRGDFKGENTVGRGLEQSGIPVLVNSGITLDVGKERIFLAGVDDGWVRLNDLPKAMEKHPAGLPTIVLMHAPDFADEFHKDERIDLQLSGHSHGGQVRLPGLGSPFCPPYGKKYDKGLYRVGNMWLYTSVGLGVTAPIRFNCRPEVTEITLTV
ncbi:MAG: metallophosphoesterase [Acidobacteriota bacterium]